MPNAGKKHKLNNPVTQKMGVHVKVRNPNFKKDQPVSDKNLKFFQIPLLFDNPVQAREYAQKTYPDCPDIQTTGARVNVTIDPAVLEEIRLAEESARVGKKKGKSAEPQGGFKKNPTPMKKKAVEVIRKISKKVRAELSRPIEVAPAKIVGKV